MTRLVSGQELIDRKIMDVMVPYKASTDRTSFGLSEIGYDVRIHEQLSIQYERAATIDGYESPANQTVTTTYMLQNPEKTIATSANYNVDPIYNVAFTNKVILTERHEFWKRRTMIYDSSEVDEISYKTGNVILVSTVESFNMPNNMIGIIYNKSTWTRLGITIPPCTIEPGYKGNLTLALQLPQEPINDKITAYNIMAGEGIAHILFYELDHEVGPYTGKYQNSIGITHALDPIPTTKLKTLKF